MSFWVKNKSGNCLSTCFVYVCVFLNTCYVHMFQIYKSMLLKWQKMLWSFGYYPPPRVPHQEFHFAEKYFVAWILFFFHFLPATSSYSNLRPKGRSCLYESSDWMPWAPVSSCLIFLSLPRHTPSCLHLLNAGIKGLWLPNTGIKDVSDQLQARILL